MKGDLDHDQMIGRLRGMVITLTGVLSQGEAGEVEEFIEHAEFGEALRTLAWIVVEENKPISAAHMSEIRALADAMGIAHELPNSLSDQVRS